MNLFPDNPPPRPRQDDPRVKAAAVKALAEYLVEECPDVFGGHQEELERDLSKHLGLGMDGFELGKDLEYEGWEITGRVVSALEDGPDMYDAHRQLVLEWTKEHEPKPKYTLGQVVRVMTSTPPEEGPITGIYETDATYAVKTPSFIARHGDINGGVVVPYEDVLAAPQEAGA